MKNFLIAALFFGCASISRIHAQGAFVDLAGRGDGSKRQDTTKQDTEAAFKAARQGNPAPLLALTNLEGRKPEARDALYLTWRAFALILLRRDAEAVELARQAEALVQPELKKYGSSRAMDEIVRVYILTGRGLEAVRYQRLLRSSFPREDDLANSLAWLLATYPDAKVRNGQEALQLALIANKIGGFRDPSAADTYAATAAECGRFEEAVARQREAVLRGSRDPDWNAATRAGAQARLKLYERRQPYRQAIGREGLLQMLRERE
ncbi:MAG: hypothetical protein JSR82_24245 [Verrucomicrobia bacterium]|nr:hypothetical protein [Verrucomicrobiota bacterium]